MRVDLGDGVYADLLRDGVVIDKGIGEPLKLRAAQVVRLVTALERQVGLRP